MKQTRSLFIHSLSVSNLHFVFLVYKLIIIFIDLTFRLPSTHKLHQITYDQNWERSQYSFNYKIMTVSLRLVLVSM